MKKKTRTAQKLQMIPNKRAFGLIILLLMLITTFHYFTESRDWQLHDFFRRLYYFPIIIAAFKFRLRGALVVSVLTVILYAPHLLVYFGELNMELVNQLLEAVMFVVLGLITGYLVEEDYKARRGLEDQIIKVGNLEKYTRNLLNSIDTGVVAFGEEGNLQSMNKEAQRIFHSPENAHRFIRKNQIKKKLQQALETGRTYSGSETAYKTKTGPMLFLKTTIFPVRGVSDRIEGAVLMIEDVTILRELEEQVRRGERLAAVGELSSGVAHEIRNPLGIIKTISQSIQEENTDEDIKESLEIIEQEIHRANKVVEGLLDFAKPGKLKREEISFQRLLRELELMTGKLAEQNGFRLILEPTEEDYMIEGDPDKLKQGLLNLVLNGIQAMEERKIREAERQETVMQETDTEEADRKKAETKEEMEAAERLETGTVRIQLTEPKAEELPNGKKIRLIIQDQGIGIDPDNIKKIYDPFFTTKDRGSGLGLSITHRIIEEHQGSLEIKSEGKKGTEVIIELPYISKEGGRHA
ncbi:two-component system sensor histidine kinase NtrB [Isachenkonia alkalipeptolytica]|uniref:histidine kinase n=1 Tax=Isachenkonia alkalipeptolytica TaxID=2565777 RepID=A0AA43XM26_9CLOT|nr:ATP-binding protein [Isachenkonia alkalipeptolytica]NBG88834.1 PAS domain S-box protein [Isachenkonia alkalipeptolytica]